MPLLDHFRPPLSEERTWEGFHCAWANTIAFALNDALPPQYFAEAHVRWGGTAEIDVAAFEKFPAHHNGHGGLATAVYAPPAPTQTIPVALPWTDAVEVRVVRIESGPELVAAIELVSPANKDRAAHRRAFALKCAAYLQQGVAVVVVDVASRKANLHGEILQLAGESGAGGAAPAGELSAASYRTTFLDEGAELQLWHEVLRVGDSLPTLPLWIDAQTALPLELDSTYEDTYRSLRLQV